LLAPVEVEFGRANGWHNGGTGGYRSMLAFTPLTDRAVVVLCAAGLGHEVDTVALKALAAVQPR
jgi:hypothetical protein